MTKTSAGLTFYEHAETPGLGGEIESEKFKAAWRNTAADDATDTGEPAETDESAEEGESTEAEAAPGRSLSLFDDEGNVIVEVVKGAATQPSHQVDGLSGATITSRGVSNLVRYWLDSDGYGPLLQSMQAGEFDNKLKEVKGGSDG